MVRPQPVEQNPQTIPVVASGALTRGNLAQPEPARRPQQFASQAAIPCAEEAQGHGGSPRSVNTGLAEGASRKPSRHPRPDHGGEEEVALGRFTGRSTPQSASMAAAEVIPVRPGRSHDRQGRQDDAPHDAEDAPQPCRPLERSAEQQSRRSQRARDPTWRIGGPASPRARAWRTSRRAGRWRRPKSGADSVPPKQLGMLDAAIPSAARTSGQAEHDHRAART